jgi:hypothetical protein
MAARTFGPQQLLSAPLERRFFRKRELRDERKDSEQAGDKHGLSAHAQRRPPSIHQGICQRRLLYDENALFTG